MRTLTKIACRSLGTVGMGIALYDASRVAGQFAKNQAQKTQANYLEKTYFDSRTTDDISFVQNNVRNKVFDLHTRNPIPAIWGKIKGGFNGFMYGIGNMLPMVLSAALALTGKNFLAKLGCVGIGLCASYNILRNGLGVGKRNPMD